MKPSKRIIHSVQSGHCLLTQHGKIEFILKKSSGRRTMCITITDKAQVQIAAPYHSSFKQIEAFIGEKSGWIVNKIEAALRNKSVIDAKSFSDGEEFLFLGRKCVLLVKELDIKRPRIGFDGHKWTVVVPWGLSEQGRQEAVKKKMVKWYRSQAEEILGGRVFHFSRIMKKEPKKIAIRTQKRIWGCCDYAAQTIHLNWLIILSPIKVIDYVVVHEMSHLFIPNHSQRFWNKVAQYMPDFKEYRKWLKNNSLDMVLP